MTINDELVNKVFDAIHFLPFSGERAAVKEILEDGAVLKESTYEMAKQICDTLEIERRINRPAIHKVLSQC